MNKAAETVCGAIIGLDVRTVIVNNKAYSVTPPTINKIAGAGYYLSNIEEGKTMREVLMTLNNVDTVAHALSWMIQGDDSLFKELSQGTFDEIVEALEETYSLISAENFSKLLVLAKSVANLTAKQRL